MVTAETSTQPLDVVELIEWFEDVADRRTTSEALTLASNDRSARMTMLRAFYERLAAHRQFSGVWPRGLDIGAVYPTITPDVVMDAPRFVWLGITVTDEPAAEAIQLMAQLKAFGRLPTSPRWLHDASYGELEAVFGPHLFANPGEVSSHAFAVLGEPIGGRAATMAAATRVLDTVLAAGGALLHDGGALGFDAPRSQARALIAAGWLQRLASELPIVLVIDDAHRAGPFVRTLVDAALSTDARILVVLAGATEASSERGRNIACRPHSAAGDVLAALDASIPGDVFTINHVRAAARSIEVSDPRPLVDELLAADVLRRISADVVAFSDDRCGDVTSSTLARDVADDTADRDTLATLVEYGAAAVGRDGVDDHESRWRFARLLACYGEVDRAAQLVARCAVSPVERAALAAWEAASGRCPSAPRDDNATDDASRHPFTTAEAIVMATAVHAPAAPNLTVDDLTGALAHLHRTYDDADGFDDAVRIRLAVARVALGAGDLRIVDDAFGGDARRWLSEPAGQQLDRLATWRDRPAIVARSVEVLANLTLISALRNAVPGSIALARALLARLELLERIGRLETAQDALAIAREAHRLLQPGRRRNPELAWHATRWLAWTTMRHGDPATATALFDALIGEQEAQLAPHGSALLDARQWRARCMIELGRFDEAHADIDLVLDQCTRRCDAGDPRLVEAHHWHGTVLTKLGQVESALDELADVVARRERGRVAHDEDLLDSRLRYALALSGAGRYHDALAQYDVVVDRRLSIDLDDAPRLLAARHARATCLTMMGRSDDAIADIDAVVNARIEALALDAPAVIDARSDRAACLTMLGRYDEAIVDLDVVIAARSGTHRRDDPALLISRQQRAIALAASGQHAPAITEIDSILAAATTWPPDEPMLHNLRTIREHLVAQAAA